MQGMVRRRSSMMPGGPSQDSERQATPPPLYAVPPGTTLVPPTRTTSRSPSSASSSTATVVSDPSAASTSGEAGAVDRPPPIDDPHPTRPGAGPDGGLLRQGSVLVRKAPGVIMREMVKDYRNDMIAMVGEFVGTVLFLMLSLGSVQSIATNIEMGNTSDNPNGDLASRLISNYYKAAAFGFALFATASIFYRFTGSIFNPSVSLALCIIGAMRPARFVMVSAAQILGGIVASYLVHALLPGKPQYNLYLTAGTSITQGLFIEMFATITLVMNVLMQGAEKHVMTPHAPLGFGITLFVIVLFSVEYTGCGINVARAFGSACVIGFTPYHWIYWLGPTLGSLLAVGCYALLKAIRYWDINPGQDATQPLDQIKPEPPTAGPPERSDSSPV